MEIELGYTHMGMPVSISQAMIDEFARVTGDTNPLHIDPVVAANSIFGGTIAHGMLVASLVSKVLGIEWPGPGTVYKSQSAYWKRPVRPGDVLQVGLRLFSASGREATIITTVRNQRDELVMHGRAVVLLPKGWTVILGEADEVAA